MVQKLMGTLNFLTKVIVPGRTFTRRMYDKLKMCENVGHPLKQYHHIKVNREFQKDCQMWKVFLKHSDSDHCLLCRPFIDITNCVVHYKVLNFYSDASLNAETGGLGAVFNNRYIFGSLSKEFIESQQSSIDFLELAAVYIALFT